MAHLGHPIVADKLYTSRDRLTVGDVLGHAVPNADEILIERQALHAFRLKLSHPLTGVPLEFQAPLPEDMERVLVALRGYRN